MVRKGLVADENALFAVPVGKIRVGSHAEARDYRIVATVAAAIFRLRSNQILVGMVVVDDEVAAGNVVRREGHAQHAGLAVVAHAIGDVQKGLRQHLPVLDDADRAALLDDKEAAATVTGVGQVDGRRQPLGDLAQAKFSLRRALYRPHRQRGPADQGSDAERHRQQREANLPVLHVDSP